MYGTQDYMLLGFWPCNPLALPSQTGCAPSPCFSHFFKKKSWISHCKPKRSALYIYTHFRLLKLGIPSGDGDDGGSEDGGLVVILPVHFDLFLFCSVWVHFSLL